MSTTDLSLADLRYHLTEVRTHLTADIDLAQMTRGLTPDERYALGLEIADVSQLLQRTAVVQFQATDLLMA